MGTCSKCNGTGICKNGIHKEDGWLDTVVNQTTGGLHECPDCGNTADNPGDCPNCGGTGEYGDD